jgi:hypothetical protein
MFGELRIPIAARVTFKQEQNSFLKWAHRQSKKPAGPGSRVSGSRDIFVKLGMAHARIVGRSNCLKVTWG